LTVSNARPAVSPRLARLPRSFYERPVLQIARGVLGRLLVYESPRGRVSGRIVEVEAYRGADDPASHAFRGPTRRNSVMFGPPGHAYVYFTYGMHHCMNIVAGGAGRASAVLVRALEPVEGIELMRERRGIDAWERLARGPGCVTQALGLDRTHNGLDLVRGPLYLDAMAPRRQGLPITAGPRIGIRLARTRPWRFFLDGHPCVSGPRPRSAAGRVHR